MADNIQTNIQIKADTKQALDKVRELNQVISQFNRAVNQQNADAMKTAKALEKQVLGTNFANNFNTQIIRMSSSVEQFSQKLDKSKANFQDYRKLLDRENGMLEQVAQRRVKLMQSMQIALTGQIRGGQRGALIIPQEFDKLNSATANLNAFGKQMDLATQKTIVLNEAMRQGAIALTNWGKNMQWAGRQLTVGLTLPITAFSAIAVKSFTDVEEQLIQIRRVYGDLETTDYEKALGEKQIVEAAEAWTKYGVSVADALKVGAQVAATGATGSEAVQQMNEAIRFATLGNFELADSQQAVIAMMSSMGIASEDLRKEIDFLNAVENQTLLTMQDVADAVPRVGPVLKDMGGDVRDLTAFLAAMKEGGVDAAEGANALKSGLASLINPTTEAKEAFGEFGINLTEVVSQGAGDPVKMIQDLSAQLQGLSELGQQRLVETLFGKYQFARWSALFDNINKAGSQAQETLELAGMSAQELAQISAGELAKIEQSPLTQFNKNLEDLKKALVPIGEMVLKVLNPFLEALGGIAEFIGQNDIAKWAIGLGGAFIAVVGPITMFAGLMANLLGNLIQFRAFLRRRSTGETFMSELEIQGKLAAAALDDFGREAQQGLSVLNAQSTAVRDLATEYNMLAASVERAKMEISHTVNDPTRSRPGTDVAGQRASQYHYRRRFATGGTVPGTGSGDKIPAMLEPGEFVVSKSAAQKFRPTLDAMNSGAVEGMQAGGAVGKHRTHAQENIFNIDIASITMQQIELVRQTDAKVAGVIESMVRFQRVVESASHGAESFATVLADETSDITQSFNKLDQATKDTILTLSRTNPQQLREAATALGQQNVRAVGGLRYFGTRETNIRMRPDQGGQELSVWLSEMQDNRTALQRWTPTIQLLDKESKQLLLEMENSDQILSKWEQELIKEAKLLAGPGGKITDPMLAKAAQQATAKFSAAGGQQAQLAKIINAISATPIAVRFGVPKEAQQAYGNVGIPTEFRQSTSGKKRPFISVLGSKIGQGTSEYSRAVNVRQRVAEQLGTGVIGTLRKTTRSESPSKEAKEVGKDIDKGLALGMMEGIPQVKAAAVQVSEAAMKSLQVHEPLPTIAPAYAPNRVQQAQQAVAERERHVQAAREMIAAQPILPSPATPQRIAQAQTFMTRTGRMPNLATQTEQLADANEHGAVAAKAASDANDKVSREATEAAGDLNKLSTSSNKATKELTEQTRGIGGFNKFLFGLDAVSGMLMFSEGKLGDFAQKLFIASSALSALSLIPGVGKAGAAAKSGIMGLLGSLGPRLVAAGPAIAGVAVAAGALAGAFYLVEKSLNKYDTALADTTENIKVASEIFGFEMQEPQIKGVGGEQKTSELSNQVKQFLDETIKNQVDFIKTIRDEQDRQAVIKSIVAQYIASGMPAEAAQELGRQIAGATGTALTDYLKDIPTFYDEEGRFKSSDKQVTETIVNDIMAPFTDAIKEIPSLGAPGPHSEQNKVATTIRNWIMPGEDKVAVEEGTTDILETTVNAIAPTVTTLGTLLQKGAISTEKYFASIDQMVSVQQAYGKDVKYLTDQFVKANPDLEYLKENLTKTGKQAQLMGLQMANVDITPLITALAKVDPNNKKQVADFQTFVDEYQAGAEQILKHQDAIINRTGEYGKGGPAQTIREQTDIQNKARKAQESLDAEIQDLQNKIEDIDDSYQGRFDQFEEDQYNIDRLNYGYQVQVDLIQEKIDKEQEAIDLIEEEIDKIEEARDEQIDSIEKTADAQIKNLERLQDAAQRGQEEQRAFSQIGQALQSGDISAALQLQQDYTQDFGQDSYQRQIDAINEWKDASIDAINDQADAEIEAQEKIRKAHEETIKTYEKDMKWYQDKIDANDRLSRSIQEQVAQLEHARDVEKKGYEASIEEKQNQQRHNANIITQTQKVIDQQNGIIQGIKDRAQAEIAGLEDFIKAFPGLSKEDIAKIMSGENLKNYLELSGGPETITIDVNGTPYEFKPKKHSGGMITAADKTGVEKGLAADEVPAVLQTGEFVVQRSAVKKLGTNLLHKLNSSNIGAQHESQLNSQGYERYHDGGTVGDIGGITAGFGNMFNAMMNDAIHEQLVKNMAVPLALAAHQSQQEFEYSGPLAEVDWSKVSGGPGGGWHWPAPGYAQQWNDFGYIGNRTDSKGNPRRHAGWDIGMPNGSIVHAIRSGTVVSSAHSGSGAGTWMAVDHGGGLFTRYLHLAQPLRKIGDYVEGGSPIARADSSGTSVPHLHFEITTNRDFSDFKAAFDPIKWFKLHEPYSYHDGGVVGSNEVPAILEKGEFVIPKDGWQYGAGNMSMPTYSSGSAGNNFSMPTYTSGNSSFAPVAVSAGNGGSGGGGASSSYSNNASNAYTINVNVNGTNASATEIANTVYARINRTQRIQRR